MLEPKNRSLLSSHEVQSWMRRRPFVWALHWSFLRFFSWHVISQSKGPSKARVLAAEHVLFFKSIFQHMIHLGMAFHWILGPSIFDHTTAEKTRVRNLHLQPFMHKKQKPATVKSQDSSSKSYWLLIYHRQFPTAIGFTISHPSRPSFDHLDLWPWTLWRGRKFAISGQPYSGRQAGCWINLRIQVWRETKHHKQTYMYCKWYINTYDIMYIHLWYDHTCG